MYKFKAKLALLLALCILLCSVNSMKVEATSVAVFGGITASSLFQICLFVGGVALTCYAAGEIIENKDEIAAFGKNFLDSVTDIPEGWVMNMTDISGQEYVFGSEALELVQDTSWEVIQGGAPNGDDDNNNNDDEDKKGMLNLTGSSNQLYASFTALGATWFADAAGKLYQKWVNGEELTETEQAALKPLIKAGVDQNDIKQQWSGEPFPYTMDFDYSYKISSGIYEGSISNVCDHFTTDLSYPVCGVYYYDETNLCWKLSLYSLYNEKLSFVKGTHELTAYRNGSMTQHQIYNDRIFSASTLGVFITDLLSIHFSANCPIFSSQIEAEAYLKGTGAVTDALNYAHTYENADWLSDDWKGYLVDPLTNIGLSLSQLIDLMKALGVYTVGNNLSAQDLAELLKQSLPAVNPDLMPDVEPVSPAVPNPDLVPIYYPSPTAHPLPGTNPDPGTNPGDNPNPTPDVDKSPLGDLTEDNAEEKTDSIIDSVMPVFTDIGLELQKKFPFSIPWDMYNILTFLGSGDYGTASASMSYSLDDSGIVLLSDDSGSSGGGGASRPDDSGGSHGGSGGSRPGNDSSGGGGAARPSGAPVFQIPFQISKSLGIEGTVLIDMEPFQVLSDISRTMFTCIFCLGLLHLTLKVFDSLVNFFPAD